MTGDARRRAEQLFQVTVDSSPADREEVLRRASGDDHALADEVRAMLRAHDDGMRGFLDPTSTALHRVVPLAGGLDDLAAQTGGFTSPSLSLQTAQQLIGERYRLERVSGSGGMGRVFEATDTLLQRRVAIKMLLDPVSSHAPSPGDSTAQAAQRRLLGEARAMANLRHSNLCRVFEVAVDAALPYIVMDWIDGVDLRHAWRNLPLESRLVIFRQVVDAVAALHHADVIHGDVKPANVLVDSSGQPVIVDFGLSRGAASHQQGIIAGGTPGFAAPEQFEPGRAIDARSDVYSLGVLMFEMLTDRLPYSGQTALDQIEAAREYDPPLPETFAPDAPWPLQRICLAALERDPSHRYANAHVMSLDLQRYMRGETVAARPTVLSGQFVDGVERQIDQIDSWRRQGLVTESESNRLTRLLEALLRPDSHWILDSRSLTLSQVTLYLGGWMALIALTIGMLLTGEAGGMFETDALGAWPAVRYLSAFAVAVIFLAAGLVLDRRGQQRISLGYQVTACLAIPVAVWLMFRETQWLGATMIETITSADPAAPPHKINREWMPVLLGEEVESTQGLRNRQALIIALVWLAAALSLRRVSGSSAFTLFAVIAGAAITVFVWASFGLLTTDREAYALLGLWLAIVGAIGLGPGLILNTREAEHAHRLGRTRVRTHDSWPVLTVSLVLLVIGLTMTAWNAGDIYTLGFMREYDDPSTRAVAFIINGVVLQLIAHVLARRKTIVRSRLAEAIRWISPSHFLAGLLTLQLDAETGWWLFWLITLAIGSIAVSLLSVWKQWRPFLFTGLFYLAIAYARAFFEALEHSGDDTASLDRTRLILAAVMLILGIATMLLAWKLPDWLATVRLQRSARR